MKLPTLFRKLSKLIPAILIRFISFSYIHQQCAVMWQGQRAESFSIGNGVRQGAVASPVFFNIYIDLLFKELADSGNGCYIEGLFHGAVGYADDISLLSPTREGLQKMINLSEQFFSSLGITVSTNVILEKSKTKVLYFGKTTNPTPLRLYNKVIPYVIQAKHLGHVIHTDGSWEHDLAQKKRELVGKFHSLRQELGQQDPGVYMRLINIYILHMYGCCLWDIFSEGAEKLWSEWHRMIRDLFNLPYGTHRYILNAISGVHHLKIKVIRRFAKFYRKLEKSGNPLINNLFNKQYSDYRSSFGRNHNNVALVSNSQDLSIAKILNIKLHEIPEGQQWRVDMVKELCQVRNNNLNLPELSDTELDAVLDHICRD